MNRNGFSLVELMLVISIIGILLAISTLNFNNWMTRQNIDREVKEMHADIMSMRQRAIATGQNYDVAFPTAGTLVFRRYSSEAEDRGSEGIVVQRKSLRYPVTLSSAGPIEFNERGMTSECNGKDSLYLYRCETCFGCVGDYPIQGQYGKNKKSGE